MPFKLQFKLISILWLKTYLSALNDTSLSEYLEQMEINEVRIKTLLSNSKVNNVAYENFDYLKEENIIKNINRIDGDLRALYIGCKKIVEFNKKIIDQVLAKIADNKRLDFEKKSEFEEKTRDKKLLKQDNEKKINSVENEAQLNKLLEKLTKEIDETKKIVDKNEIRLNVDKHTFSDIKTRQCIFLIQLQIINYKRYEIDLYDNDKKNDEKKKNEKTADNLFKDLYYLDLSFEKEEKTINEFVDLSIKKKENIHDQIKYLNIAMINRYYIKNKITCVLITVKEYVDKIEKEKLPLESSHKLLQSFNIHSENLQSIFKKNNIEINEIDYKIKNLQVKNDEIDTKVSHVMHNTDFVLYKKSNAHFNPSQTIIFYNEKNSKNHENKIEILKIEEDRILTNINPDKTQNTGKFGIGKLFISKTEVMTQEEVKAKFDELLDKSKNNKGLEIFYFFISLKYLNILIGKQYFEMCRPELINLYEDDFKKFGIEEFKFKKFISSSLYEKIEYLDNFSETYEFTDSDILYKETEGEIQQKNIITKEHTQNKQHLNSNSTTNLRTDPEKGNNSNAFNNGMNALSENTNLSISKNNLTDSTNHQQLANESKEAEDKPFFKRIWVIVIVVLTVITSIGVIIFYFKRK